jgi:hypothetical protein
VLQLSHLRSDYPFSVCRRKQSTGAIESARSKSVDPLDDVADDVRYGIYTFMTSSEKPRELVIAEVVRRLGQQGDLTSASIRYQQMIAETQVAAPV